MLSQQRERQGMSDSFDFVLSQPKSTRSTVDRLTLVLLAM